MNPTAQTPAEQALQATPMNQEETNSILNDINPPADLIEPELPAAGPGLLRPVEPEADKQSQGRKEC